MALEKHTTKWYPKLEQYFSHNTQSKQLFIIRIIYNNITVNIIRNELHIIS